jgi:hypothetical protein
VEIPVGEGEQDLKDGNAERKLSGGMRRSRHARDYTASRYTALRMANGKW